jgi:hypothetical protein
MPRLAVSALHQVRAGEAILGRYRFPAQPKATAPVRYGCRFSSRCATSAARRRCG